MSTTLRAYNVITDQWDLVSVDGRGTGLKNVGTARRGNGTMHVDQEFGAGTPWGWRSRITYHDIGPNKFSWKSDRSVDNGKTWILDYQQIEAQRVGPPRDWPALTKHAPVH